MPTTLDQIVSTTRQRVAQTRRTADVRQLEKLASQHVPRGFCAALQKASQNAPAVIAELKKASPSKGLIRADFAPEKLAPELQRAGAAALSVLTDEPYFQGSLENLRLASANTQIPCLRKDFVVDEFQILEARANQADAILLIVAALSQQELLQFAGRARDFELDVLCEAHDKAELMRAVDAGFDLIGINNRDLRTFHVDIETAVRLAEFMPKNVVRVAESGIHSAADIAHLRSAGYAAFLIGESLMKAQSPGEELRRLLAASENKVVSSSH